MKLLAFDTATEACSAALYLDGEVRERYEVAPRGHARLLLPMIEALLAEAQMTLAQLDALAFGRGPGSFTGVRIAAGVAQGIAFGARLPVVPVSTLDALACAALQQTDADHVLAAIDARMAEIYWAAYRRTALGLPERLGDEQVTAAAQVSLAAGIAAAASWCGTGTGWGVAGAVLRERLDAPVPIVLAEALPRAAHIAILGAQAVERGETVSAGQALPVYLRNQVAVKPEQPHAPTR